VKNWCPTTFLNCDYHLASKATANRLKKFFPNLIECDHTGFIKNRFIGKNIRLVDREMKFAAAKNLCGLLLFLDFEKAFNTINVFIA